MSIKFTIKPEQKQNGQFEFNSQFQIQNELKQRRYIRIQQVRQQSKDIAKTIRNNVKSEEMKLLNKIEKQRNAELKNWQNNKLVQMKSKHLDLVNDVGSAHNAAVIEVAKEEELFKHSKTKKNKAIDRGYRAQQLEQIMRNEQTRKTVEMRQNRQLIRDFENMRATLVSNIDGKHSLTSCDVTKSKESDDGLTSFSQHKSPKTRNAEKLLDDVKNGGVSVKQMETVDGERFDKSTSTPTISIEDIRNSKNHVEPLQLVNASKSCSGNGSEVSLHSETITIPYGGRDTRISDHIRSRRLTCSNISKEFELSLSQGITINQTPPLSLHVQPTETQTFNERVLSPIAEEFSLEHTSICGEEDCSKKPFNMPFKQTIRLVPSNENVVHQHTLPQRASNYSCVQHYDYKNRFHSQYLTNNANIEQIHPSSLEVDVGDCNFSRAYENKPVDINKRKAEIRGRIAMEKERNVKECDQMKRQLPALIKSKNIACIGKDQPKFHMSGVRLMEMKRKHQNHLDNVFNRMVPNVNTLHANNHATINKCHDKNLVQAIKTPGANEDDFFSLTHTDCVTSNTISAQNKDDVRLLSTPDQLDHHLSEISAKIPLKKTEIMISSNDEKQIPCQSKQEIQRLVLQNTSTQTTPISPLSPKRLKDSDGYSENKLNKKQKVENYEPALTIEKKTIEDKDDDSRLDTAKSSAHKITSKKDGHVSLKSNTETEKLCEIRISIQKNEDPDITICSPRKYREKISHNQPVIKDSRTMRDNLTTYNEPSLNKHSSQNSSSSTSYYNHPNLDKIVSTHEDTMREINPRLLTYIKKLLDMSKHEIDDMGVSSVSEISTPNSSILNTTANNSLNILGSVMKYFNLTAGDIARYLNDEQANFTKGAESTDIADIHSDSSTLNDNSDKSVKLNSLPSAFSKYSEVANDCHKRISDLTAEIEKLRKEKLKLIESHSDSDKDNSTLYFNIPAQLAQKTTASSNEQEELTKRLLKLEMPIAAATTKARTIDISSANKDTDKDLVERYIRIKSDTTMGVEESYANIFADFPRLPKLTTPSINLTGNGNNCKRPPLSKGLTAARRFNTDISAIPHELSTIAEAESVLSSKFLNQDVLGAQLVQKESSYDNSHEDKTKSSTSSDSLPDILTQLIEVALDDEKKSLNETAKNSGSDSSHDPNRNVESMETILRQIGMSWAIPTLRKTHEALANSSSTSPEVSGRLQELADPAFSSRSTNLSFSQGGSRAQDISEVSPSFLNGTSDRSNRSNRSNVRPVRDNRTSTPVHSTRSSDRRPDKMFASESDISSVQVPPEEQISSIPFIDDTVSSHRSK